MSAAGSPALLERISSAARAPSACDLRGFETLNCRAENCGRLPHFSAGSTGTHAARECAPRGVRSPHRRRCRTPPVRAASLAHAHLLMIYFVSCAHGRHRWPAALLRESLLGALCGCASARRAASPAHAPLDVSCVESCAAGLASSVRRNSLRPTPDAPTNAPLPSASRLRASPLRSSSLICLRMPNCARTQSGCWRS